jgi:hypothetical protein
MAANEKVSRELMIRALDLHCAKKISTLAREQGTTKNQIVRRLLNEVTKNDELLAELFAGDGTESQLRRFTNLLPALSWGDNAFQKRQSLEVLDFYSAILGESSYDVFPGVMQIARYRCGFASLDVALDFEKQGLIELEPELLSLSDRFVCLGLAFFRYYGTNCEALNKPWHEGMSHYNLACAFAQRARLAVYRSKIKQVHDFVSSQSDEIITEIDHELVWSAQGPVTHWRVDSNNLTLRMVTECKTESLTELRRMCFTRANHLATWIADTESDPDLVILRKDEEFKTEFQKWVSNAKADLNVSGNIITSSKALIDSIKLRQPDIVAYHQAEENRAKQG